MPADVKAVLSLIVLVVAAAFAFWERSGGKAHLFWVVIAFGIFAVAAMWVFPEAVGKTDSNRAR